MGCKKCGCNLDFTSKFCSNCGQQIPTNQDNMTSELDVNNKNIKKIKQNKLKLLGFRSGKWYKMIIASLYLIFMLLFLILIIFSKNELATSTQDKVVYRFSGIILYVSMVLPYIIMSNVFGLRTKLPLYRSEGKMLKIVAVFLTVLIMFAFFGTVTDFYTEEYKAITQVQSNQQENYQSQNEQQDLVDELYVQNDNAEQIKPEEIAEPIEQTPEDFPKNEDIITDASEIMVSSVQTINGERIVEQVPITRTVNGVRVRTVTTKTEGVGIVKIVETIDVIEGLDELLEFGYTREEILENEKILSSVGINEVYLKDYFVNGIMGTARAYIYDSEGIQLNLTFENNKLFYVQITGIVEDFDEDSTRQDKLDLDVGLQGYTAVDMYYDYEGGELAYLDWDFKTINKVQ